MQARTVVILGGGVGGVVAARELRRRLPRPHRIVLIDREREHAIRSGEPIADRRLETLRRTTRELVRSRGWISRDDVEAFLAVGFTQAQLLDVIVGIAQKTISNYTNHVAGTPLDRPFARFAWSRAEATASR